MPPVISAKDHAFRTPENDRNTRGKANTRYNERCAAMFICLSIPCPPCLEIIMGIVPHPAPASKRQPPEYGTMLGRVCKLGLEVGNGSSDLARGLLFPETSTVLFESGQIGDLFVQLARHLPVDVCVLVGSELAGLPMWFECRSHDAADVLLHLQGQCTASGRGVW